jgi:hypothetical protein
VDDEAPICQLADGMTFNFFSAKNISRGVVTRLLVVAPSTALETPLYIL